MNAYDCPQCGSHNTQSFENIYSSNVRYSYGGTRGSYESWNQLAAQTAPPAGPHVGCGSVLVTSLLIGVVAAVTGIGLYNFLLLKPLESLIGENRATTVFFAVIFAGAATFIGGLVYISKRVNKQLPDYRKKVADWNQSMMCRRCGHAWLRNI